MGLQADDKKSSVLALEWPHTIPANDTLPEAIAHLSLPPASQVKSQQPLSCPLASQQTAVEAARLPAKIAPAISNIAEPQAVSSTESGTRTAVVPAAVSKQATPQLVTFTLEQRQPVIARVDLPQPATARVDHPPPATYSAASEHGNLVPAISQGFQPQSVIPETDLPCDATTSEADQPQLATSEEGQPQPAVTQFLDLLFPPEQLQAQPSQLPSSLARSAAVSEPPVPSPDTGKAEAMMMTVAGRKRFSETDVAEECVML